VVADAHDVEKIRELLVQRNNAADPEGARWAFEQLVAQYERAAKSAIRRVCRDSADAEDALQATWLKLWNIYIEPERALRPADLVGLVRVIAFQQAVEIVRRPKPDELSFEIARSGSQPRQLMSRYLYEFLFDGLLPPHQVITVAYRDILGHPPRDIVQYFSAESLRDLMVRFVSEQRSRIENLAQICKPLIHKLDRPLDDILLDPNTRRAHSAILDRVCGETTLREYETTRLEDDMSKWGLAVMRGLRRKFDE
jgi:hypothetical protein